MNALEDFKQEFFVEFKEDADRYLNFLQDFREIAVYINGKYGNKSFEPISMEYILEKENLFREYLKKKRQEDKCFSCEIYLREKEKSIEMYDSVFDSVAAMKDFVKRCRETCQC